MYDNLRYSFCFQIPDYLGENEYKLKVEAVLEEKHNIIFFNETGLHLNPKQASVFVQMSQPIYKQGQTGKQS